VRSLLDDIAEYQGEGGYTWVRKMLNISQGRVAACLKIGLELYFLQAGG